MRVLAVEGVNKLINTSQLCAAKSFKLWKDVDENGTIFFNLQKSDTPALAIGASTFGISPFPYKLSLFRLQQNSTDGSPHVSFMASPSSNSNISKLGNLSWENAKVMNKLRKL